MHALARRFRQWFRRPERPVGDVADESWTQVGPLPPAPLMGLDEIRLIPLDLPAPPPLPMDARPPRTRDAAAAPIPEAIEDDGGWETLIAAAKSRPASAPARPTAALVRTPPPVRLAAFARDTRPAREDEERGWEQLIARAKRRTTNAPTRSAAAPRRRPGHETGDWSAVIAAAKLR